MTAKDSLSVILPAAGKSSRFGGGKTKKVFAPLLGKPVWLRSAELFASLETVDQIVVVLASEDMEFFCQEFSDDIKRLSLKVVEGGKERHHSVQNGLNAICQDSASKQDSVQWVAIHDAARPLVKPEQILEVFDAAKDSGAAILASPITATIKRVKDNTVDRTIDRSGLFAAQTPQIFQVQKIRDAYQALADSDQDFLPTDECLLMESLSIPVAVVSGDDQNIKITQKNDLVLAEAIMNTRIQNS